MAKTFRGEAVVHLPRTSNNAGHGMLRLACRVKLFQTFQPLLMLHILRWLRTRSFRYLIDIVLIKTLAEKISRNVRVKPHWLLVDIYTRTLGLY